MVNEHLAGEIRDPEPKVRAAIEELRKGHRVGRTLLRNVGPRAKLGQHEIDKAAEEHHYTADACRKLRQFAALYDKEDLKELCDLCRRHHRAFGLTLVYKLVTIAAPEERKAFQQEAVAEHWGHARISRELRARFGRRDEDRGRGQRGRRALISGDVEDALSQIEEMTARLLRWQKHFDDMVKQGLAGRLPPAVARKLRVAINSSMALHASATRASQRSPGQG